MKKTGRQQSMLSVNKARLSVITYPEIIGLFITFIAILYLLYPKEMLEKQVLSESSNYDLTTAYLENMLRLDPSNKTLMLVLAKTAQKSGKNDLALRLLELLIKDKDAVMTSEVLQLKYRLLKSDYQHLTDKKQQKIKIQLAKLLQKIGILNMINISDREYWYQELIWSENYVKAFDLIQNVLKKNPHDIFWMKQCYTIALKLDRKDESEACLDRLLHDDNEQHEYWLAQAYSFARQNHNDKKAKVLLEELKKYSQKWTEEEAKLALQTGVYQQASDIYLQLSENAKEQSKQKEWLLLALSSLQQGNLMEEAVTLAKRFEIHYINDSEMMEIWLKLYLSAGDLKSASQLSKILLEKGGVK